MPNKKHMETPWERQKGESAQAFEAFLIYLNMGADRSIRAVAQKCSKNVSLIQRWSSAQNWVERCREWDNYLQREAKKAAVKEVKKMARRHAKMAMTIQTAAMNALKEAGSGMVDKKNFAAIVKLATELESKSRLTEVSSFSEDTGTQTAGPNTLADELVELYRKQEENQSD